MKKITGIGMFLTAILTAGAFEVDLFQPERRPLPVSFSVPKADGQADTDFAVTAAGRQLPVQREVLSRYPSGSPRWVRLTVPAVSGPLEVTPGGKPLPVAEPVRVKESPDQVILDNGQTTVGIDSRNGTVTCRRGVETFSFTPPVVTLADGFRPAVKVTSCTVLTRGPLRTTVRLRGEYLGGPAADGRYWELAVTSFAGSPYLEIVPLIGFYRRQPATTAAGEMTRTASVILPFQGSFAAAPLNAEVTGGTPVKLAASSQAVQWEFDRYEVETGGKTVAATGQLTGIFTLSAGKQTMTAVFEELPEQYPAGIKRTATGFEMELLPAIVPVNRYHGRKNEHIHTYYLRDGLYTIRGGVEKSYRLYAGLSDGDRTTAVATAKTLPVQPVGLVEINYLNQTGAWPHRVTPPNEFSSAYDRVIKTGAAAYFARQRQERWYGALNWGDWFGERVCNWGNHEYDTPTVFFEHALRFRDPEYFREALRGARHFIDVDIVKRHPDRNQIGGVWAHSLGHTGGYFDKDSFKLENYGQSSEVFIDGRHSAGHTRARGTVLAYLFSGDPRFREQAVNIGEFIRRDEMFRKRNWTLTAREPGWALFNLCSIYDLTAAPAVLQTARELGAIVIERAEGHGVKFARLSKWNAPPKPGGMTAADKKYLTGELSFPTGYQAAGMMELYRLTGDPAIRTNLLQTAAYVKERLYDRERHGFIHSPCPWRSQNVRLGGCHANALRYVLAFELAETGDTADAAIIAETIGNMFRRQEYFDSPLKGEKPDYPHPKSFSSSIYFWPQTWMLLQRHSAKNLK